MNNSTSSQAADSFSKLVEIMARLRAPDGCPWDREQTFDTIKPYLLEETYEVLQAIDDRDWKELADELGDLLLQVVFFSQMAAEAGHFNVNDAVEAINSKLIRRHPHVFGDGDAKTSAEVLKKWDEIKATEKVRPKGLLASIPKALPALVEGDKIARKAAGAGFDWPNIDQVFDKLKEEVDELHEARVTGTQEEIEGEVGDLLFVVVNLARFLKVDPEQALRKTNTKFRRRFAHVEDNLGKPLKEASLEEMEALWQAAKQQE
ncbi:MAG: nucleoside triphosphate pyrophosphohydrolase [Bryobacteraceae bacterium]